MYLVGTRFGESCVCVLFSMECDDFTSFLPPSPILVFTKSNCYFIVDIFVLLRILPQKHQCCDLQFNSWASWVVFFFCFFLFFFFVFFWGGGGVVLIFKPGLSHY